MWDIFSKTIDFLCPLDVLGLAVFPESLGLPIIEEGLGVRLGRAPFPVAMVVGDFHPLLEGEMLPMW